MMLAFNTFVYNQIAPVTLWSSIVLSLRIIKHLAVAAAIPTSVSFGIFENEKRPVDYIR